MNENPLAWLQVAKVVIDDCTAVKIGERVLIIGDTRANAGLIEALGLIAQQAGADVMTTIVPWRKPYPHGYLSWQEPPERLWQLVANSDVVIDYRNVLMALTSAIRASDRSRIRVFYLNSEFDYLRPLVVEEDLDEMGALGSRITEAVSQTKHIHVTTQIGTDVQAQLIQPVSVTYDDRRAREPGTEDYFPGGMWSTSAIEGTMNGVVYFDASLHPIGILSEPVRVTWENGRITQIEGGWQAIRWREWLESFNEPEIYGHSHMGGGLSKKAGLTGHDWEDLIIYGSALFSGGNNIYHGGNQKGASHFDAIVTNATIYLDGEMICRDGIYLI